MNEAPNPTGSPKPGGALRLEKASRAQVLAGRENRRSSTSIPDPEVAAKGQRRRFTAEYKRRMLAEAERCKRPGELAALLRREGLYSSHLANWKAARDRGDLAAGAAPRKRGPKPLVVDPSGKRIAELERELAKVKARAERAELLVEAQKKMAALLEHLQHEDGNET